MIALHTSYSFSQVPYITNEALDSYAEELVRDFAPNVLESPGILDVDRFLEYYLRLSVDYRRICLNRNVLGITAFNDGVVDVMCEERGQAENIQYH